jgi:hypothetical protein
MAAIFQDKSHILKAKALVCGWTQFQIYNLGMFM